MTMPQAATRYRRGKTNRRKWDSSMPCRAYHKLYDKQAWRRLRRSHLAANPLCEACRSRGLTRLASVIDHIVPHRGDTETFFDAENLQSLCKRSHDRKTAMESAPPRRGSVGG